MTLKLMAIRGKSDYLCIIVAAPQIPASYGECEFMRSIRPKYNISIRHLGGLKCAN
jgi:hypothetical protein